VAKGPFHDLRTHVRDEDAPGDSDARRSKSGWGIGLQTTLIYADMRRAHEVI